MFNVAKGCESVITIQAQFLFRVSHVLFNAKLNFPRTFFRRTFFFGQDIGQTNIPKGIYLSCLLSVSVSRTVDRTYFFVLSFVLFWS